MPSKIDRFVGPPYKGDTGSSPIMVDSGNGSLEWNNNGTAMEAVDLSNTQTVTGVKTFSGDCVFSGDPDFTGSPTGAVVSKQVAFVENGAGTSYVGTVPLPAGAMLHDIQFVTGVLWDGTSATLKVGDDDDDDGYFTGVNLKATDLLVGEQLNISNAENWGGANGAYLVAATGRKGQATADAPAGFYTTANNIIATITPGAADGSAGRSYMTVTYSVPTAIAQVAT